jgi:RNA polymerase sigma factor (sigma-70 family)
MARETINRMDVHEVVTQFAPALARVVASYERDRTLRADLLQEVLIAIMTSLPRLADPDKLKPFVFRIAHNRCLSHVAKRMRERASEQPLEDLASEEPDQEQALMDAERSGRLLQAVRRLALPYRQVVTLILEDLSYDEVAEVLGISVANVGIRVNRAKQQLTVMLGHE